MKKILALTITLCMTLLIFSSCGGKNKKTDGQSLKDELESLPVELDDFASTFICDLQVTLGRGLRSI